MKQVKKGYVLLLVISLTTAFNSICAMNNSHDRVVTPENSPTSAVLCCGLFGEPSTASTTQDLQERQTQSLKKKKSKKLPVARENLAIYTNAEPIEIAQTPPVRAYTTIQQAVVIAVYEDELQEDQQLQPRQMPNRMDTLLARLRGNR